MFGDRPPSSSGSGMPLVAAARSDANRSSINGITPSLALLGVRLVDHAAISSLSVHPGVILGLMISLHLLRL